MPFSDHKCFTSELERHSPIYKLQYTIARKGYSALLQTTMYEGYYSKL